MAREPLGEFDRSRPAALPLPDEEPILADALARHLAGTTSPTIALMTLLHAARDVGRVERFLARAALTEAARGPVHALHALLLEHRDGCEAVLAVLAAVDAPIDHARDPVDACRALFDRAASIDEEASVALYSLGSPALLASATAELVSDLSRRGVLGPTREALEIGCGIGRVLTALAPHVARIAGLDASARMVAAARRRTAALGNVTVAETDGRRLDLDERSLDLVLAVDAWPYLVQAGGAIVEAHVASIARSLRAGGDFVVLNWSYRADADADLADARALAAAHGLLPVTLGEAPLRSWDARLFHLRRP